MTYASEVLADSPIAYYRMGEASGTTAADSSGNGRNATYMGGPTLGVTGLLVGDPDTAVDFSGTRYVTQAPAAWQSPTSLTAEAWVNLDSLSGYRFVINRDPATGTVAARSWSLHVKDSRIGCFLAGSGGLTEHSGTIPLSAGTTYHLVLTYDSTTGAVKLYVNGVLDVSATSTAGTLRADTSYGLEIGRAAFPAFYVDGRIDECALYDTVLSSTRVAAHYTAGTTVASVTVAGSTANVTVSAHLGATRVPVLHAGSTAGVVVTGYAGAVVVGGSPVTVSGATANVATSAYAGVAISGALPVVVAGAVANVAIQGHAGTAGYQAITGTSAEYANDGYNYDGTAAVYFEPPIAETPEHIRRVKVMQVHQSMSAPNLVNGVPR